MSRRMATIEWLRPSFGLRHFDDLRHTPPMSSRHSLFVQLCFALLLVFAQQQAVQHALDHDFERIHASIKDVSSHDDAVCAKCLAVAHLGHANGAAWSQAVVADYAPPLVAHVVADGTSPAFVGVYLGRAPPLFS